MSNTISIRFDTGIQQWIRSDQPHSPGWDDRIFRALMARDFPTVPVDQDRTYRLTIEAGRPVRAVAVT